MFRRYSAARRARSGHSFTAQITRRRFVAAVMSSAVIALAAGGCGGGSKNSPTGPGPSGEEERVVVPLEGAMSGVELHAGLVTQQVFTIQMPTSTRKIASARIDIAATLKNHGQLEHVLLPAARRLASRAGLADAPTVTVSIRVGSDPDSVCTNGRLYGPFVATFSSSLEVNPPSVLADSATVEIMGTGGLAVCATITPNFDGTVNLDSLETAVVEEDCGAPANFSGDWSGTYYCSDHCTAIPEGGPVSLTVTQTDSVTSYQDEDGTVFTGFVCGNSFRFVNYGKNSIERGVMSLTDATHAYKHSTWRSTFPPYCGGDCSDILTRASPR